MSIDIYQVHNLVSLTGSFNDAEALLALKDLRAMLEQNGARLEDVVHYAVTSDDFWQGLASAHQRAAGGRADEAGGQTQAGLPLCRWANANGAPGIETAPPNGTPRQWALTGGAATKAEQIAELLKDALIVAGINSCTMKIKLKDVEDERGKVVETIVQTEYSKDLAPIILWTGDRGDAATLASTLRQAASYALGG